MSNKNNTNKNFYKHIVSYFRYSESYNESLFSLN